MTLFTLSFPPSNTTSAPSRNLDMWVLLTSPHLLTTVAFVDYSTAYPKVHRDRLLSILLHNGIVRHVWHHLGTRIDTIRLGVLHPNIREDETLDILRGLPQGSRFSPTLHSASENPFRGLRAFQNGCSRTRSHADASTHKKGASFASSDTFA